jgi:transcriptional regulator with XRE-family HTH domain
MKSRVRGTPTARQRFAARVREERLSKGFSQEALAEAADLHRTYISSIERCERNVTVDNMERIAIALGVDISDLLARPVAR